MSDASFTSRAGRALVSPLALILAVAGTAGGAVLGLEVASIATGAAGWAGGAIVAARSQRPAAGKPSRERIDPFRVGEPWRRFVMDAQQAKRRFDETVRRGRSGPLLDRLEEIAAKIDEAVEECWEIARQGDQLDAAWRALDVRRIEMQLEDIHEERRRQAHDERADEALYKAQLAVEAQLEAADRLRTVAIDAENRLRLLNAQLDEAVARSMELSLTAGDVTQLGGVTADVDHVVEELEALRLGLEEVAGVARGTPGTGRRGTA